MNIKSNNNCKNEGFTLLELLLAILIMTLLAVFLYLTLNPVEISKRLRDSQRMSDLATLKNAIGFYQINTPQSFFTGVDSFGCKGTATSQEWQATDYIYYSYPSDGSGAEITAKTLDGMTFTIGGAHQVPSTNLYGVDGVGWLPINFLTLAGGSPISKLPIDPVNTIADPANPRSTDLVYRYICLESTLKYEINATLESYAYTVSDNKMAKDGGNNDNYYEVGTDLSVFYSENSACVPNCLNKNCGNNGCSGSCGNCSGTMICANGVCENAPFVCGDNFTDSRDSLVYSTINLNGQCWLSRNLAYLPSVSPSATGATNTPQFYVYDYQGANTIAAKLTSNYLNYGALYNHLASVTACPAGWHLPSDAEWTTLINFAGGTSAAGSALKASSTNIIPWDGQDSMRFSILPEGRRHVAGSFFSQGTNAYYWSATTNVSGAWTRGFSSGLNAVSRAVNNLDYGYPIRCVKD